MKNCQVCHQFIIALRRAAGEGDVAAVDGQRRTAHVDQVAGVDVEAVIAGAA